MLPVRGGLSGRGGFRRLVCCRALLFRGFALLTIALTHADTRFLRLRRHFLPDKDVDVVLDGALAAELASAATAGRCVNLDRVRKTAGILRRPA